MRKHGTYGFGILLAVLLAGCQWLAPRETVLDSSRTWLPRHYERQDQLDVLWRDKSFSLLLYQTQQGNTLSVLGLSYSGQTLFFLRYDGSTIELVERVDAMRLLPFDWLLRDILLATDADFSPAGLTRRDSESGQDIYQGRRQIAVLQHSATEISLRNRQTAYRLIFRALPEAGESL